MSERPSLWERIRQHCETRRWYGPDVEQHWKLARSVIIYDADGVAHPWDPTQHETGFTAPPATGEQIERAERALGCALPAALTQVYEMVANGCFGPGYGLFPVESLHREPGGGWRLSPLAAASMEAHPRRYLECDELPDDLAQLCDWGCGLGSYLDLSTGWVYGAGCGIRSDWNGVDPDASEYVTWIDFQARSVEDWLERWLAGRLYQPGPTWKDSVTFKN